MTELVNAVNTFGEPEFLTQTDVAILAGIPFDINTGEIVPHAYQADVCSGERKCCCGNYEGSALHL